MKHLKLIIFTCILTIAISCGQQKRYVSYKIKEGETVEDVAKRLNMKTEDLLRLNPNIGKSPSVNTSIVIPSEKSKNIQHNNTVTKTKQKQAEEQPDETESNQEETVTNNIEEDNNETESTTEEKTNKVRKSFIFHEVKPKETVYGLKRLYNVPIDSIYELNPGLKENGLKIGQIVKVKAILVKAEESEEGEESEELISMYQDAIQPEINIKAAYLLPFVGKNYDTLSPSDIFEGKKNLLADMVTDFYLGAEIAIDSLQNQGVNIKAHFFDTGKKGQNITRILEEGKLNDVNVVIGPFYSEKAQLVAQSVEVPVIFPHYSSNQTTFSSKKLIKTSPDMSTHANYLVSYLKQKYNGETVFVVGDGTQSSNKQVNLIVAGLKAGNTVNNIHILKPQKGYIKKERFTNKMNPKTHNWVIMTSNRNASVADALNSMIVLPEKVTAQVFAVNKNSAYDKIDNNKLAHINLTYVTNMFINYENIEGIRKFNKMYLRKNYALPSDYAIKGFDITYDILMRLASGGDLYSTFKKGTSLRVENKFDYNKKSLGTTSNSGLFIVKYNKDLTLTRLR